jgi:glutamyl-tRNA synthetase
MNGKFILRLEDTDRSRFDPAFVQNLFDSFNWLGLHWDEGPDIGGPDAPYVQSERAAVYRKYAQELLDSGAAYYCFCSAERLDAVRKQRAEARSSESGYDRHCRGIDRAEAEARAASEPHTVRLRLPQDGRTLLNDALLGPVEWKNADISPDPVLLKSDGFPTYHLANVADDHLMRITHVLRAQEWLSSTPLHLVMYAAFGWEPPVFCHLPMVMGQDGKKLSKRHGATSIDEFRRGGYLPDALLNYVALLGASYEEGKVIYSLDELAARFSLDKLNKAPAVFDYKKLGWYNGQYIRMKSDAELAGLALPAAVGAGLFGPNREPPDAEQRALWAAAMPLVRERAMFLHEIPAKLDYLFREPLIDPAQFTLKMSALGDAVRILRMTRELVAPIAESDDDYADRLVREKSELECVRLNHLLAPLRAAITGSRVSPPLFPSIRLLGASRSLLRVDRALERLEKLL